MSSPTIGDWIAPGGVPTPESELVREMRAMLAVSRTVARGGQLEGVLDRISAEAAGVVGACSASILLVRADGRFELAGGHGLSTAYRRAMNGAPLQITRGHGPSGLAVATGEPVVIHDITSDPRFGRWSELARTERFRGQVCVPLGGDDVALGALNAYWEAAGSAPRRHVELLSFFADHAASAIRTAQLIERQAVEMRVLSRLVRGLREQTHEYANRIHAVSGLLSLGDLGEARRFVSDIEQLYHQRHDALAARIQVATLAGLVMAEAAIAAQHGVVVELGEDSSLARLPAALDELAAVTLVGNLLRNAVEAVIGLPAERRRVRLELASDERGLRIAVADRGRGLPDHVRTRLSAAGATTKPGHSGLGLALVSRTVAAARGEAHVESNPEGTVVTVLIPGDAHLADADR